MVGRLAPTPSGHLHLGNALAFGAAWLAAKDGELLLRVEDIDRGRSRSEIAQAQREDLRWLGLTWDREVPPQSQRSYSTAGLPVYRCNCTRAQRRSGVCPHRERPSETGALRLRSARLPVTFMDLAQGPQCVTPEQDPLLIRRDGEPGYPLAVVVDDHRDGVTQVVRGSDLLEPTALQVELYGRMGWPLPSFLHVPMLLGEDGRKLSKSHGSREIRALRAAGVRAAQIWEVLLPLLGVQGGLEQGVLSPEGVRKGPFVVRGELELIEVRA